MTNKEILAEMLTLVNSLTDTFKKFNSKGARLNSRCVAVRFDLLRLKQGLQQLSDTVATEEQKERL